MTSIVVGKDRINLLESERYLAGTKNLYTIKVSFSDDWCDLEKRITFKTDKFEMSVSILGMCETLPIPWEVFREPSVKLQVGAYGYRCNELALNTRWASLGRIWKGMLDSVCGCGHPTGPVQPSPKSFEILQAMIERKADRLTYEDEMLTLWSGNDPLSSFELLLGSILPTGGLTDQVLAKASDKDGDYYWATLPEIPEIPEKPEPPQEITKEITINLNIPRGMIFLWFGPLDSIPSGYSLCDGQNGTIDLRDVFITGIGDTFEPDDNISTASILPEPEPTPDPEPETPHYALAFIQKMSLESADVGGGMSAYEIALANGFKGTENEWLKSLRGAPGKPVLPVISNVTIDSVMLTLNKPENPKWPEWLERPHRPEKPERPHRPEKPEKLERSLTPEEPTESETPEKPDRPDRPEKPEKPDRPEKPEKPDRPEKPEIKEEPLTSGDYIFENVTFSTKGTEQEKLILFKKNVVHLDVTDSTIVATLLNNGRYVCKLDDVKDIVAITYETLADQVTASGGSSNSGGTPGQKGDPGDSAYQVAVKNGFVGTEEQWLESLKGSPGTTGKSAYEVAVKNGFVGTETEWLESLKGSSTGGGKGEKGDPGDSAYQVAVENGFTGTEQQWLESLKGDPGNSAYKVAVENGFTGTEQQWLESLKGDPGNSGNSAYDVAVKNGFVGTEQQWLDSLKGKSAYDIAVDHGFKGTEEEWLESLKGESTMYGKSAYEIAVEYGFVGTVPEWLESLKGAGGKSAYQIAVDHGFVGTEAEWLESLKGSSTGSGKGEKGDPGDSAYQVAVKNGFVGTEQQWLESLKGNAIPTLTVIENKTIDSRSKMPQTGSYIFRNVVLAATKLSRSAPVTGYNFPDDVVYVNVDYETQATVDTLDNKHLVCLFNSVGTIIEIREEQLSAGDGSGSGVPGKSAYEIAVANGFVGTEQQWLESLKGKPGVKGDPGLPGDNGASAYDIAVLNGYTGTETQWLASLKGTKGDDGKSAYELAVANGYTGTENDWLESLKGKTVQGLPDYSTGEMIAARWIDNRPIYRCVIRTTVTTSNNEAIVVTVNNATPVHMYGTIESQNGSALCMVPGVYDSQQYGLIYEEANGEVKLWSSASSITAKELTLVLEYVKDNDGPLSDDDLIIDSSNSGGTKDHRELTNRDAQAQHPIAAIDGLQKILSTTPTKSITDEELEELFK